MPRLLHLVCSFVLSLMIATAALAQEKPRIVAVNHPLAFFAERLVEGDAEVVFPVPDGVDPSFWRPSISDISMIQSADLILLNGAGFATWVDRVSLPRSKLVNTSAAIEDQFIVTESITHSHGDGGEHSHEGLASYTWLDPMLAIAQAEAIASAIIRKGLVSEDDVQDRLEALSGDLEALDSQTAATLADAAAVPMIATHPRYQYFARRYGLSVASLEWEAGAAPSEEDLAALSALVSETGAKVLIWEAEPASGAEDAVAGLGLQSATFDPLAHAPGSLPYLEAITEAASALSEAAALADQP